MPEKPDYFRDFRRGVALLAVILFLACLVPIGYLMWAAVAGEADKPSAVDAVGFGAVGVPLAGAAITGVGVLRTNEVERSRRLGRLTGLFLLAAAMLLVVTG